MDLQIAADSATDYTNFNQQNMNINIVKWNVNDTPLAQNVYLVIAANVLCDHSFSLLKNLATAIKSGCFILLEETGEIHVDLKTLLKEANLMLVGKQIDFLEKNYFLLKKPEKKKESVVIEITGKDFSWLETVKAAMRKLDSADQEVLFVSQGEESFGNYTFTLLL